MTLQNTEAISAEFPFEKKKVQVLDGEIAYVDTGASGGPVVVFLHGNPTSSYLWRNVIPHISGKARCVAPDLIGFGDSSKITGLEYRFVDHQRYLDAFLDTILPTEQLTLVVHDWGSALGFDWARRHEDRVDGLAFMEFIPTADSWESLPQPMAENFRLFRDPTLGRDLLIKQNLFIEKVLPFSIVRQLTEEEMNVYRQPFLELSSREPLWRFPNEIPIEGEPADVWDKAQTYLTWLFETELPKLFFWATPGGTISEERAVQFIKRLRNTNTVYVGSGVHFLQEDHPHRIGREIAKWLPSTAKEQ
ncbi:hypothetical protein ACHAPJ_013567 [Fusarium lateritium]